MPTNTLKDAQIKAAKAVERPYKLFDGGGLFLFVSPTGAKTWRIAYRLNGKPQTKSFGPYPAVSLADAREKRDSLKATLREGGDPMAERKARRKGLSLREAAETYWNGRGDVTENYRGNALRGIEMYLYPSLGDLPIGSVTRDMLLDALRLLDAKGHYVYVRRVRMWIGQVFEWAVEHGHATINPAALIRPEKAFGRASVENFPALELRDLPEFFKRLDYERELQSVLACRFLALTWVRTSEMRLARWSEIDGETWIIPAGKMKRRREHVVPLSRQALAILNELRKRTSSDYVFPNDRRDDRPMSENAVLYLLGRIGYKGRMTGHGFRTVASTWANERGYIRDAIERQLAHAPDDKVRSAYNRAEYLPERRRMLQDFADWIDSYRQVDSVIAER